MVFVRARLGEVEEIANAAIGVAFVTTGVWECPGPYPVDGEGDPTMGEVISVLREGIATDLLWEQARHVAEWDPTRALAEVVVKRALVDAYVVAEFDRAHWSATGNELVKAQHEARYSAWLYVMHTLAGLWADHQDYPVEPPGSGSSRGLGRDLRDGGGVSLPVPHRPTFSPLLTILEGVRLGLRDQEARLEALAEEYEHRADLADAETDAAGVLREVARTLRGLLG